MPTSLIPTLLLYVLVVGYSPGPANLYSFSCSVKYGIRQSLVMWLGLLCGFSLTLVAVTFATHFIGEHLGNCVVYLKYAGAAYILYLAWNIYRSKDMETRGRVVCSFLSGALVQMTNAKMILFELTVFGIFVLPYSSSLGDLFMVSPFLLLAGPIGNLAWLLLGSWLNRYLSKYHRQTDTVMALCLALCAVLIIFG